MENFYIAVIVFLMILAAVDLFVGVSNDAVNFLNSAIGSRVASFRRVMVVASLGVLLGCTFSSGMMEIAKSGIFHPQMFNFEQIMVIFFAVMITDVLLLDTFNSLGLPTSTTVSIVFELLGGAVVTAGYSLWVNSGSIASLGDYINSAKALAIIMGILISVVIAFFSGLIVQYVTRLIFTFNYQTMYRRIGGVFGGFAITAIFYFLVMKGAKGASFMRPEYLSWINAHTTEILLTLFVFLTVVFQVAIWLFRVNIFKLVILSGTFSLAFAFAGNDLVNFVGVPLAALDSLQLWRDSGVGANELMMGSLKNAVKTPTIYLVIAGFLMVATLWFSRKAQRVVQTSINLSASSRGEKEKFGASLPGRLIVRSSLSVGKVVTQILPTGIMNAISSRMEPLPLKKGEIALPFDQVRASINLVVASILIASATSLKLPLSTTYVTFMVAMGSSLADGAWDRESAVYRISGVLSVISGWFITAISAFLACGLAAYLTLQFGAFFMVVGGLVVVAVLVKSNFFGKDQEESAFEAGVNEHVSKEELRSQLNHAIEQNLRETTILFTRATRAFLSENRVELKELCNEATTLFESISDKRGQYYRMVVSGQGQEADYDARNYYYRTFSNMKDVASTLRHLIGFSENHVANSHSVFQGILRDNLLRLAAQLSILQDSMSNYVKTDNADESSLMELSNTTLEKLNDFQLELLRQIDDRHLSLHGSELYLLFLQFAREVVNRYTVIALLQHELNEDMNKQDKTISLHSLKTPQ